MKTGRDYMEKFEREYYREKFSKISTATISDALDSLNIAGGLRNIQQRVEGANCVGFAFTVRLKLIDEEFHEADNFIEDVQSDEVIVIDNANRDYCTAWGNILTEVAVHTGIVGTVVYGAVRDLEKIRNLQYPLYSSYVFMQSGKARVQKDCYQCSVEISGVTIDPGDLICADSDGCVVIPQEKLNEVLLRSEAIAETETFIIKGVRSGKSLQFLRQQLGYAKPWEGKGRYHASSP